MPADHQIFSMFPADVLKSDFLPVAKVLEEMATTMPTLTKAIKAGEFPRLYRIAGKLYSARADLAAHKAKMSALANSALN